MDWLKDPMKKIRDALIALKKAEIAEDYQFREAKRKQSVRGEKARSAGREPFKPGRPKGSKDNKKRTRRSSKGNIPNN